MVLLYSIFRVKFEQSICGTMVLVSGEVANVPNAVTVWIDGGCADNGTKFAIGGVGLYWGADSPKNQGVQLGHDELQGSFTNNRAELYAAILALKQALQMDDIQGSLIIKSDSLYVINGIRSYIDKWKGNGWITANKEPVKNKDLWLQLDEIHQSCANKFEVVWDHVKGHIDTGNVQADRLASQAIEQAKLATKQVKVLPNNITLGEVNMPMSDKEKEVDCPICKNHKDLNSKSIQCNNCLLWIHFNCTQLPRYQLYVYDSTNRKYMCELCAVTPDTFLPLPGHHVGLYSGQVKQMKETGTNTLPIELKETDRPTSIQHKEMKETGTNTLPIEMKETGTEPITRDLN